MTIDYETMLAAQRARMDIIRWIFQEIDRSPRAQAMMAKAKQEASKPEAESKPAREAEATARRKPKRKRSQAQWKAPWPRGG